MSYEYYLVCNCLVGAVVGGGAYSFVACLSHSTIDHASLSRRSTVPSTVPTPNKRHLQHLGAQYDFLLYFRPMLMGTVS